MAGQFQFLIILNEVLISGVDFDIVFIKSIIFKTNHCNIFASFLAYSCSIQQIGLSMPELYLKSIQKIIIIESSFPQKCYIIDYKWAAVLSR